MIRFDQAPDTPLFHEPCGFDLTCESWEFLIESSLENGEFFCCPECGEPILFADDLQPC